MECYKIREKRYEKRDTREEIREKRYERRDTREERREKREGDTCKVTEVDASCTAIHAMYCSTSPEGILQQVKVVQDGEHPKKEGWCSRGRSRSRL